MTETWLKKADNAKVFEIREHGFNIYNMPRSRTGGGVAFLCRDNFSVQRHNIPKRKSFEVIETILKGGEDLIRFCTIYRTSVTSAQRTDYEDKKIQNFFEEFPQYLDSLIMKPGKTIIGGDLNFHLEDPNNIHANKFKDIIDSRGFIQHVSESTHVSGGILDVVITRKNVADTIKVNNVSVHSITGTKSDHFLVTFDIPFQTGGPTCTSKVDIEYRELKQLNIEDIKRNILDSALNNPQNFTDINNAVHLYQSVLSSLLDTHAPVVQKTVKKKKNPWWNHACQNARQIRRRAERSYKKNKSKSTKEIFQRASADAEKTINDTRNEYYRNKLQAHEGDPKATYAIVNNLLDKQFVKNQLPNGKSDEIVAEQLKDYFTHKIRNIYNEIEEHNVLANERLVAIDVTNSVEHDIDNLPGLGCEYFAPITADELKKIITDMGKKTCCLDPMPTSILLQCIDELLPSILYIVNESLQKGIFPDQLKDAAVRPSLKKHNLDSDELKSYRPISNLSFLSKIIEKCVHIQLTKYLDENNLHAKHQSGYRVHHSCESAITKIHNDLLIMVDKRDHAVLLLLDLSAAFDTLNHSLLITKLKRNFNLKGNVLKWLESYLQGRSMTIKVNRATSGKCVLTIGVPQGSILGPLLFILYTAELESIARKHGFSIHLYADDTQIYMAFDPKDTTKPYESSLRACLEEITQWMYTNYLKLNEEKTELIEIRPSTHSTSSITSIKYNVQNIEPSPYGKSLGIIFDSSISMKKQVNDVSKTCYMNLRNIGRIGNKLQHSLKVQLVHSLILSRIDYCNSIYCNMPENCTSKLQKIQNAAVRFIYGLFGKKKQQHISPYLKKLHFLPVFFRLKYKIALMCHKCVNNIAPPYLSDLITMKKYTEKDLRSDNDFFLLCHPPKPNYEKTRCAFIYSAPQIWNDLPYNIRSTPNTISFKNELKTHFFNIAFKDVPDLPD